METGKILQRIIFVLLFIISVIISISDTISLLIFVFNIEDIIILQLFVIQLFLATVFWGATFYVAKLDKNYNKQLLIKEMLVKSPTILLSVLITGTYVLLYFFIFSFLTVSKYGKGGWGGDANEALSWLFIIIAIIIFSLVMYKIFRTDKQDISLFLYNQFSVLKWSSLIALPFGIWSAFYFYREKNWAAIVIWSVLLYLIYSFFKKTSEKVQDAITDANLNRIIHENKKRVISQNDGGQMNETEKNISVADELTKLKTLLEKGVITADEFEQQKRKLLNI